MSSAIHCFREGNIAKVVLARPDLGNALTAVEMHALAGLLGDLDSDRSIRAIVLTGQGRRAFCAGLNLKDEQGIAAEMARDGPTGLGAVLRQSARMATPLLGRINGACVAGGVGLAAACHVTVADETAVFGLPEITVGFYPFVVMAALWGRIPPGVLTGLATSARYIAAAEACSVGLTAVCVPTEQMDHMTDQIAHNVMSLKDGIHTLRFLQSAEASDSFEARLAQAEQRTKAFWRAKLVNS